MVVVFSRHSNESPHVQREVLLSINYGCRLIPFRVDETAPTEGMEYCLCTQHWVDGPGRRDDMKLGSLVDAVSRLLGAETVPAKAASPGTPGEPALDPMQRQRACLCAAEAMVEQGTTAIRLARLPAGEQRLVRLLVKDGTLLSAPRSPTEDEILLPAPGAACPEILAEWVAKHVGMPIRDLLDTVARLPSLAAGVGTFLNRQVNPAQHPLYSACLETEHPSVRPIAAELFARSTGSETGLVALAQAAVSGGNREAIAGILEGVGQLVDAGEYAKAGPLLDVLRSWSLPTLGKAPDRLAVSVENEYGTFLKRTNSVDDALAQFRSALQAAAGLEDPQLLGQISHNIAWSLLERPDPSAEQWQEAVELLTRNETLFTDPAALLDLACTHNLLGEAYAMPGAPHRDVALAEKSFRRDVSLCREAGKELPLIDALDRLGAFLVEEGETVAAQRILEEELDLCMHCGEPPRRGARALANLGTCYLRSGYRMPDGKERTATLQRAADRLSQSRRLYRTLDEPRHLAAALNNLGRVLILLGEEDEGVEALRAGIAQYRCVPGMDGKAAEIEAEVRQWQAGREQT
jgi:Tfp pilus assembly protein PilF